MFNDPTHPDLQKLAEHHEQGTTDQIPAEHAADAIASFHENADPSLVKQVTDEHYAGLTPEQLQEAAAAFKAKLAGVAETSPEAATHAAIDPATATPEQVAAAHRFAVSQHPELARDVLIGAGVVGAGTLAALAARHFIKSRG